MKDAARAEGPEGPKLLCFELGRTTSRARPEKYKILVMKGANLLRRRVGRRDDEGLDGLARGGHLDGLAGLGEDGLGGRDERITRRDAVTRTYLLNRRIT